MVEKAGISKLDLKRRNRTEILKLLAYYGPMSRIDIARRLTLTRAAVTIITNEMIEEKVIYEVGEIQRPAGDKIPRGRKKILLDLCENYRFSFGIVIDAEKTFVGLTDLTGHTLEKTVLASGNTPLPEIMEQVCLAVERMMENNCLTEQNLLGIGICISENAYPSLGYLNRAECMGIVKKLSERRFKVPVAVDCTTESLLLAELLFYPDAGNKPEDMVLIRYGYDIDAALMIDERVYKRKSGKIGGLAHMVVDTHGERCSCGKIGCCGTRMSIQNIITKIKSMYSRTQTPYLYEMTQGDPGKLVFSIDNLKQFVMDPGVQKLYQEALEYLTTALDNILNLLDPDKIILFGFVFEKILDLDMLISLMEKEHNWKLKDRIAASSIPDDHIYLAGNALCMSQFFLEKGGMQDKIK